VKDEEEKQQNKKRKKKLCNRKSTARSIERYGF
jgi:hypothetical protein